MEPIIKCCTTCKENKNIEEFSNLKGGKYGKHSQCKSCKRLHSNNRVKNLTMRNLEDILYPEHKKCSSCDSIKSNDQFHKNICLVDGLNNICIACNIGRVSEYSKNNKDGVNRRSRESKKRHPDKRAAQESKRRAIKKNATHPDIDYDKIKELFSEAKLLEIKTGVPHHVDHIFPLSQAPNCKIHHQDNLQIIPHHINLDKNNSLTYYHPDIIHWKDLPDHILKEIDPEILRVAYSV